jgi:CheY-like chemotaxis protein
VLKLMLEHLGHEVVVTDLGMPDISGREVASIVKDIRPGTPVILITAWGVQLDKAEMPEIDGLISKPFSRTSCRLS